MIRWFRSIATGSAPVDPAGSGKGFGAERNPGAARLLQRRHIRAADRTVLFLNTLLLMDIAFRSVARSPAPSRGAPRAVRRDPGTPAPGR
jgi:hypothetical protein